MISMSWINIELIIVIMVMIMIIAMELMKSVHCITMRLKNCLVV